MTTALTLTPAEPLTGPARERLVERLASFVRFAVRAPSSHNTQPWLFRIAGDALELRADRTRALPVVDPQDRELTISCGAALGFLDVAIRAAGQLPVITRLPDRADPDLLARVRLGGTRVPTAAERACFAAIVERHTSRGPYEARPVPEAVLAMLGGLTLPHGAWLRPVTADLEKAMLAELIAEGDRLQGADGAFRRELAAWVHPNHSRAPDGMTGAVFGMGDLASLAMPWILRNLDWGGGQAAKDRALALGTPALAVLGTPADDAEAWLRTGEALAWLVLQATAEGLSVSFLNQPVEVPDLRPRLASALGVVGHPQLILRLGYGGHVAESPRRRAEDVLAG